MKTIYQLLTYILAVFVLSGCTGLAPIVHGVGSMFPGPVGQGIQVGAYALDGLDKQAQRRKQEQEQQRRIDEYNRRLAAMTPNERAEFLRKEQELAESQQKVITFGLLCLLGGCGNGSSQNSDTNPGKEYAKQGLIKNAERAGGRR